MDVAYLRLADLYVRLQLFLNILTKNLSTSIPAPAELLVHSARFLFQIFCMVCSTGDS